jgi:hypothetical protein
MDTPCPITLNKEGFIKEYPFWHKRDISLPPDSALNEGLGIISIAATCIRLLGYVPPADYDPAVIQ